MNTPNTQTSRLPTNPFLRAMLSMGGLLAAFAVGTLTLCIVTFHLSKPHIDENRRQALARTLTEVFPAQGFDNDLLAAAIEIPGEPLRYKRPITAYLAKKLGQASGMIYPVAAHEGYGGTIHLLIGVDVTGTITGVRVLPPHPETPGLGDAIEVSKSDWILGFTGKSLKNTAQAQWAVKKDGGEFDSFTGATITPRAVVKSVHHALLFFETEGRQLLEEQNRTMSQNTVP